MKERLNIVEILLQSIYSIGGMQKYLDTEDIAKKAYKISPNSFCWKKYQDQIDIGKIRVNLNLAKNKNYVIGNEKSGWMLNDKGLDIIETTKNKSKNGFKLRTSKKDLIEQDKEILRISNSEVYHNYIEDKIKPTFRQAEAVFSIDSYVLGDRRKQRIKKVINLCKNNQKIYKFLQKNKQILNKQKKG